MADREKMPENERYALDIISAMAERTIRRLWVLIIILALLLFGSNAAWLAYISQYDFESYEVEMDTGGGGSANYIGDGANYIGNDGEIYNGENFGQKEFQET